MLRDGSGLSDVAAEFYKLGAIDKAISLWTMATEMHDPERAMIHLGSCYQHGMGVECNPTKAVSLYNAAANEDPDLSWHMGLCYLHGEGVPRDWPKAVALLQQSHSGEAQAYLGWCHLWGCGVERDVTKAVSLLTSLTHNQFNPIANAFLGYCYERGIGVEIDLDKAKHLYSCEENEDAEALRVLGMYCLRGDCGAPIDKKAAAAYFKRGAEKCDPVSRFHFGVCLRDGDGVECNVDEAHCWLEKAAKSGHRGASNILENIACNSPHSVRLEEHCDGMNPTEQQEDTVETLKKQVVYLKEHVAELEKKNEEEHSATISSQKAFNKKEEEFLARKEKLSRKIDRLEQDNLHLVRHVNGAELALFHERRAVRALQNEKAQLEIHLRDTEAALCKERVVVANIRKALKAVDKPQRYEDTVNTVMVGRMNPEKTARLSATNDISRLQSISPQCHQSQLQKAPSSSKTGVKPNTQRKKETPGRCHLSKRWEKDCGNLFMIQTLCPLTRQAGSLPCCWRPLVYCNLCNFLKAQPN
ncbi:3-carboxymuconate cyclase [Pelomyxa schiedti]|nr:3-carboxymuconate cyclase [Pelomyxa schiedti]